MSHQIVVRSGDRLPPAVGWTVSTSLEGSQTPISIYVFDDLDIVYDIAWLRRELRRFQDVISISCIDCSAPDVFRDHLRCRSGECVETFLDAVENGPPAFGGILVEAIATT